MFLRTLSILRLTQEQIEMVDQFLFVLQHQWTLYREFGGLEFDFKNTHSGEEQKSNAGQRSSNASREAAQQIFVQKHCSVYL